MDFKKEAAKKAITLIKNNSIVGLGAGSTMAHLALFLKEEIQKGLQVKVFSSSYNTRSLLQQNGFTSEDLSAIQKLDIYFDGCDQFDKDLNALKSGGGIHTHEKLLASMADEFIIIGDDTKYAEALGTSFPLVLEILPESVNYVIQKTAQFFTGASITMRMSDKKDGPVVTANGNYLLDIYVKEWPELQQVNFYLKSITGVVETSLFYQLAKKAIIGSAEGVILLQKKDDQILRQVF